MATIELQGYFPNFKAAPGGCLRGLKIAKPADFVPRFPEVFGASHKEERGHNPLFSSSQMQLFMMMFIQSAGDMGHVAASIVGSTEMAKIFAPLLRHYNVPPSALTGAQLQAMCVAHVNASLKMPLLARDSPMHLVLFIWHKRMSWFSHKGALASAMAWLVAEARRSSHIEARALALQAGHMINSGICDLPQLHRDAAEKDEAANNALIKHHNTFILACVRAKNSTELPIFDTLACTPYDTWADIVYTEEQLEGMSLLLDTTESSDPTLFEELRQQGLAAKDAIDAANTSMIAWEEALGHIKKMHPHLVYRAVIAAIDNLPSDDLYAWMDMYTHMDSPFPVASDHVRETEPVAVRRASPWRREVHTIDQAYFAALVDYDCHRRHAMLQDLLDDAHTKKNSAKKQKKKKKKKKKNQLRVAAAAAAAEAEAEGIALAAAAAAAEAEAEGIALAAAAAVAEAEAEGIALAAAAAAAEAEAEGIALAAAAAAAEAEAEAMAAMAAAASVAAVAAAAQEGEEEDEECVVCMARECEVKIVPCGHQVMCQECALAWMKRSTDCPYCRTTATSIVHIS